MARLMPPVLIGNREVAVHFSLPESLLARLSQTAHRLQIPRSNLFQRFLSERWSEFTSGHLMEAMALYKQCGGWFRQPAPEDAPAWLGGLVSRQQSGERQVVAVLTVGADWWRTQAEALRRVELEVYTCSLSDVMTLFFAWGWDRFENGWRSDHA